MENELQTNLDEILLDKETNLLPQNLKEGVTVLGVEGSLKVTGSDSNIKLFETVEDMNNDPNPKEDDLAVVYREELKPFKEDTETQFITFPEQFILDEPFTGNVNGMVRSVDRSVMFDGQVMLDANMFRFDGYSETGMIRVGYQSEDGITYTRQEFMGDSGDLTNPVDLGTTVKWEPMEQFNDVIGKFMLVGGNYFEGLYEFNGQLEKDLIKLIPLENVTFNLDASNGFSNFQIDYNSNYIFSLTKVVNILNKINNEYNNDTRGYILCIDSDGDLCALEGRVSDSAMFIHPANDWNNPIYDFNKNFLGIAWYRTGSYDTSTTPYIRKYSLNLNDSTFSIKGNTLPKLTGGDSSTSPHTKYWPVDIVTVPMYITISTTSSNDFTISYYASSGSTYDRVSYSFNYTNEVYQEKYRIAATQFTILPEDLYNATAYGKDGIIEGTLTQNVSNQFTDIDAEVYAKIQQQYDKLEPRILTDSDKTLDKNILVVPLKSDGTQLLNTSSVTDMSNLFMNCNKLQFIYAINTINATNMSNLFRNCNNLMSIPNLDTNNVTNMTNMFRDCTNIVNIPELNTNNAIDMFCMFLNCKSLTSISNLNASNVVNMYSMFSNCSSLTTVSNLNTSEVNTTRYMFSGCTNLTNISNFNTQNVLDTYCMFSGCTNITSIPYFNTSNVTNISSMFVNCYNLTSVPNLDTSNANTMANMFVNCYNLTTIPNFDTSKVTNMHRTFAFCTNLTTIPLLDTSNVVNMYSMFSNCSSLTTIPNFDTSKVNSMGSMFADCSSLTTIPNFDTSSLVRTYYMFENCSSLTTIPNINTSKVNNMYLMLFNCSNLIDVPVLNTSNVTTMNRMFTNCSNLSNASLNNILYMCATSKPSYTNYKKLSYIGLTEDQANICMNLSNYQNFINAGWTTGY